MTVKFRSCRPIALNFIYFCVSFSPPKKVSPDRLRVHSAIVEPGWVSYSLLSRVNRTIVRARRDFYERCLKVRWAPFRRHKEVRCSPRTKELSYVSRKTFSLRLRSVCACFRERFFSWVFSSTDNDGLINEHPTSSFSKMMNIPWKMKPRRYIIFHVCMKDAATAVSMSADKIHVVIRFSWKTGIYLRNK